MGSKSGGGYSRGTPRGPQLRPSKGTYAMVPVAVIAGDLLEAVPRGRSPITQASGGACVFSSVPPSASP